MPQSLARVVLHIIFSTKHRNPTIPDELAPKLHAYLVGTVEGIGCTPIQIGGVEDHIHTLAGISRTLTIAGILEELKTSSSKWMKEHGVDHFAWQAGYGAFSVSESKIPEVKQYIKRQKEHHQRRSFQEEYREFLVRHGVAFDERYVWD